jgi:hypothetical protein
MKSYFAMLLIACAGLAANAAPVVVDLSRSHTVDDLKRSGLRITKIAGGLHGQAYSFQNQEVVIRLPAGRSITQNVVLGTIDTKEDELTDLFMYGEVMPHDQALQVATLFHQSFGLPLHQLGNWGAQNKQKIRDGEPYSISANMNFYPRTGIAIKPSMNGLYPWVISFSLSWEWDKQRDWNEERASRELPPPTTASLSLNPPSGQKYERRDAYKETLEAQAQFEKELAAKGPAPAPTMTPSSPAPISTPKSSPVGQSEPQQSTTWPWIIGAILLLAVVGGILTLRRK